MHLRPALWKMAADLDIEIIASDLVQVRAAVRAFGSFGKCTRFRARLNICDCAAYASAESRAILLLFKGDDFAQTDIVSAV